MQAALSGQVGETALAAPLDGQPLGGPRPRGPIDAGPFDRRRAICPGTTSPGHPDPCPRRANIMIPSPLRGNFTGEIWTPRSPGNFVLEFWGVASFERNRGRLGLGRTRAEARGWNPYLTWIGDGLLRQTRDERSMARGDRP
jgi:hypothetical protein